MTTDRRTALATLGLAATGAAIATRAGAAAGAPLLPEGAHSLETLTTRLAKAPRRRDFKSVPMILDEPSQWDDEALKEIIAYKPTQKQVWDNTGIDSAWLNLMRNAVNVQVWSFKHPDFLCVSATHGSAQLALYDQATWDKYQLTKLAGDKLRTNTLIAERGALSDSKNYEDPKGVFSSGDNSIPLLMRRGVVFLSCHNAIWEQAGKLIEKGINPDKLSQEALTADLTNHLIEGVVLTPGAVGTIPELQQVGFHYAK